VSAKDRADLLGCQRAWWRMQYAYAGSGDHKLGSYYERKLIRHEWAILSDGVRW
jgi:hypothetical protein